jgi:hypothetical protein
VVFRLMLPMSHSHTRAARDRVVRHDPARAKNTNAGN